MHQNSHFLRCFAPLLEIVRAIAIAITLKRIQNDPSKVRALVRVFKSQQECLMQMQKRMSRLKSRMFNCVCMATMTSDCVANTSVNLSMHVCM